MKTFIFAIIVSILTSMDAQSAPVDFNSPKTAHILGEITEASAFGFEMEMLQTANLPGERTIIIDSPGGSVRAGEQMLRRIQSEQRHGVLVTCVVINSASSMAFNILTHCDKRYATVGSHMVVHKVAAGALPCDIQRCTAKQLRAYALDMERTDEPYRQSNAKAMHLSLAEYDRYADDETAWDAATLVHSGYLTGLVGV